MILFIVALVVSILCLIVTSKCECSNSTWTELLGGATFLLGITSGVVAGIMGLIGIYNNIPTVIHNNTIAYQEKYDTLTQMLEQEDIDKGYLAEEIIEYNSNIKAYNENIYNFWINWCFIPFEYEMKEINLEDYLN